jgi:hypothetical protein
MAVAIDLQIHDAESRNVVRSIAHAVCESRRGEWRVRVEESREQQTWSLKVHGPDHFTWSRMLWVGNGEQHPEFVRTVLENIVALHA